MNLVLDDAYEVYRKKGTRTSLGKASCFSPFSFVEATTTCGSLLIFTFIFFWGASVTGRILLKGDNITLMQSAGAAQ